MLVKPSLFSVGILFALATLFIAEPSGAGGSTPQNASFETLKSEKTAALTKRDARVPTILSGCESYLAKLRKENPGSGFIPLLSQEIDSIIMNSGSLSESRFKENLDLLNAIAANHKEPEASDLLPLQKRYERICQDLDDVALSKDIGRILLIHDKLIRYTSLGLWNKEKISSELERIETALANAPDLPYGRTELLNGYKNRKLVAINGLHYIGIRPHEENYLTSNRKSTGLLEETTSASIYLEAADHYIKDKNNNWLEITAANHADSMPFSPPLSLWVKSRILEGKIPIVTLHLSEKPDDLTVQDVLDGKLDDYFARTFQTLAESKTPLLVEILSPFDRNTAANSFGADGRTPFYFLLDAKLKSLSQDKLSEELKKRSEKGAFSSTKGLCPEMCNQYGEADIPDGPERVRDAWKHIKTLLVNTGGDCISLCSSAGAFHGNKNAGKYPGEENAGNQIWNNLDYYYPGNNTLEWLGIDAIGTSPLSEPKGANIMESLSSFMSDARASRWQAIPIMLSNSAPAYNPLPLQEADWVSVVFQQIIPNTYPNINIIILDSPGALTLWTRDGMTAFRTGIASNKIYKWPLRFRLLTQPKTN